MSNQNKTFVANRKTKKYHYLGCPYGKKIVKKNRVELGHVLQDKNTTYVLQDMTPCSFCKADKIQIDLDHHVESFREE